MCFVACDPFDSAEYQAKKSPVFSRASRMGRFCQYRARFCYRAAFLHPPPEGRQAGGDSADRHLEVRKSAEHRNMARCLLEVTQVPNTHGVSTDTLGWGQIPVIKI